jgi:hypothetical protein
MPNPNTLLEGNLGAISLANLLQLVALEQKTALLELRRVEVGQQARMIFHRGELIHAEVNMMTAEWAVYRILCWWNAGTFKLTELREEELPDPTIGTRMDVMLLEGMRQMDATAPLRELLPSLTSAVSFTNSAMDSFRWDLAQPAEWIPHELRVLPKSFSMAQLHAAMPYDEMRLGSLLRMLLGTSAVRVHVDAGGLDGGGGFEEVAPAPKSTRHEAFAQLLMEYVGYEQAYSILEQALFDLAWEDFESVAFTQLLDLCDRLAHALGQHVDRKTMNEAQRRLRARATSLV